MNFMKIVEENYRDDKQVLYWLVENGKKPNGVKKVLDQEDNMGRGRGTDIGNIEGLL